MVVSKLTDEEIDRIFQALADATRRDIMSRVMVQALSVSELASGYAMSFAAVQKHVAVLERAGLVSKQRRGKEQLVHGDPKALHRASNLLDAYEQVWRGRASRIENLINEDREGAGK